MAAVIVWATAALLWSSIHMSDCVVVQVGITESPEYTLRCNKFDAITLCRDPSYTEVTIIRKVSLEDNNRKTYLVCPEAYPYIQNDLNMIINFIQADCYSKANDRKIAKYEVQIANYKNAYNAICAQMQPEKMIGVVNKLEVDFDVTCVVDPPAPRPTNASPTLPKVPASTIAITTTAATTVVTASKATTAAVAPATITLGRTFSSPEATSTTQDVIASATPITKAIQPSETSTNTPEIDPTAKSSSNTGRGGLSDRDIIIIAVSCFLFLVLIAVLLGIAICHSRQTLCFSRGSGKNTTILSQGTYNNTSTPVFMLGGSERNGQNLDFSADELDSMQYGVIPAGSRMSSSALKTVPTVAVSTSSVSGPDLEGTRYSIVPFGRRKSNAASKLVLIDGVSMSGSQQDIPSFHDGIVSPYGRKRSVTSSTYGQIDNDKLATPTDDIQFGYAVEWRTTKEGESTCQSQEFAGQGMLAGATRRQSEITLVATSRDRFPVNVVNPLRRQSSPAMVDPISRSHSVPAKISYHEKFSTGGMTNICEDAEEYENGDNFAREVNLRWPYADRMRLPRTSWTGSSVASVMPVTKQDWTGRRKSVI